MAATKEKHNSLLVPVNLSEIPTYFNIGNPMDVDFGPLSIKRKAEIYIDGERWPNAEQYAFAQALCFPIYRKIMQRFKSGFKIFLDEYTEALRKNKTNQPRKPKTFEASIDVELFRQQLNIIEQNLTQAINFLFILENWDEIDDTSDHFDAKKDLSDDLVQKIKSRLLLFWPQNSTRKKKSNLSKSGASSKFSNFEKISTLQTKKEEFDAQIREFEKKVPDSETDPDEWLKNSPHKLGYKKLLTDYSKIKSELSSENLRTLLIADLKKLVHDPNHGLEKEKKETLEAIADLDKKINLSPPTVSESEEVIQKKALKEWKTLTSREKEKYHRRILPEFMGFLQTCRISKFEQFIDIAYASLLGNKTKIVVGSRDVSLEDLLIETTNSIPSSSLWPSLVYIDPISTAAQRVGASFEPMYGVVAFERKLGDRTDITFRGNNNVGKVLMKRRLELVRNREGRKIEEEEKKVLGSMTRFYRVFKSLQDLLTYRDIHEFKNLTTEDILQKLEKAARIHTTDGSYIILSIDDDVISSFKTDPTNASNLAKIHESMKNRGLPDTMAVVGIVRTHLPSLRDPLEHLVSFTFTNNIAGISDVYEYERLQPGNTANFLRKELLEILYTKQLSLERMAILRAVLGFLLITDPSTQPKVEREFVSEVIDVEIAKLYRIPGALDRLLDHVNDLYISEKINELTDETLDDETLDDYIMNFLETEKNTGRLAYRVRSAAVEQAKKWKKQTYSGSSGTKMSKLVVEDVDEDSLSLSDKKLMQDLTAEVAASISAASSKPKKRVDIIFSTKDSNECVVGLDAIISSDFAFCPTRKYATKRHDQQVLLPVIIDYLKFPTVVHAVCYLWLNRELGFARSISYLMLLHPGWANLVQTLGLFLDEEYQDRSVSFTIFEQLLRKNFQYADELVKDLWKEITLRISSIDKDREFTIPFLRDIFFTVVLLHSKEDPFLPWEKATEILRFEIDKHLFITLDTALTDFHRIKFQDVDLKKLLLSTGRYYLLNSDYRDPVMGHSSKKGGLNIAGKNLMTIRAELFENENIESLSQEYIDNVMNLLEIKLSLFKDLINLVYDKTRDKEKTTIVAKVFLEIYKLSCGGTTRTLHPDLVALIRKVTEKVAHTEPKLPRELRILSLIISYGRILVKQLENLGDESSSYIFNKMDPRSCFFEKDLDESKKEQESLETKAKVFLNKLFLCLEKLGKLDLKNINDLIEAILKQSSGRMKFIATLDFSDISQEEREKLIDGRL